MKTLKWTTLVWILVSSYAVATPLAYVSGPVTYSGSGCPSLSTSVTLPPDSTSVSALFGSYYNNFSANRYRAVLRNCTLRIPIEVSAGYRLTVNQTEYRGAATLAQRSWGYFRSYLAIKDRKGTHYSGSYLRYLLGGTDEPLNYAVNKKIRSRSCGGKMELRFYSEYYLYHFSKTESSDLAIDSLDFSLLVPGDHVTLEPCR